MPYEGRRIGHVRIEERAGGGGMGEVYRGFDEVLERRVAVKVVSGHHSWSQEARERFRHEARTLAQLDHSGVCRIYDFVDEDDTGFLILELIEGRTLAEFMQGRPSGDEVLAVLEQLADVLVAAHKRGIVHRDLKPENILLTEDNQAKVLDFGLSQILHDATAEREDGTSSGRFAEQTGDGSVVAGTVGYMAPEQARGESTSPKADLYSLGIIAQEMLTGRPAYPEVDNLFGRLALTGEAATVPMRRGDPDLVEMVERLTDIDPEARPSAAEVLRTVRHVRERPARRARRRGLIAVTLSVAGLVVAAVFVTSWVARHRPWMDEESNRRVVLLPFVNETDDSGLDWVALGLQEVTSQMLRAAVSVPVAPGDDAAEVAESLQLAHRSALSRDEVERLTDAMDAGVVVAVSVLRGESEFQLQANAYGRSGPLGSITVSQADPTEAARLLSGRLASHFSATESLDSVRRRLSEDAFANLAFGVGVSAMRTEGFDEAKRYFEAALARDPGFSQARLRLSDCELESGFPDRAHDLAVRVLKDARQSSDAALEAESLLRLGTIASFRGDFKTARQHITEALSRAEVGEATEQMVSCLNGIGRAALLQHRFDEAEEWLKRSLDLAIELGMRRDEMVALNNLGMARWKGGELDQAILDLERSLEIARDLRDRRVESSALMNLAGVAFAQNRLSEAESTFLEILALAESMDHRAAQQAALNNLGAVAVRRGDLSAAEAFLTDALELRREAGDRPGEATTLNNLGQLQFEQGKHEAAAQCWVQALRIRREMDDVQGQARVLQNQGDAAALLGQNERARRLYLSALELFEASGDEAWRASIHTKLGMLAADDRRLDDAESHLEAVARLAPDNDGALKLESRIAFARGEALRAVEFLLQLRGQMGPAWSDEEREMLATYRRAAGGDEPVLSRSPATGE